MVITEVATPFFMTENDLALAKTTVETIIRSGSVRLNSDGSVPDDVKGFLDMLQTLASGHTVAAFTRQTELTLEQASDILGIPEPDLIELLDGGEIESHQVGKQRVVVAGSLFDYDRETTRLQSEGLDELTKQAQELGLY